MSRTRWNLPMAEQRKQKELVERLIAGGADLDASSLVAKDAPRMQITQSPELLASYVHASAQGIQYYVVCLRIVAVSKIAIEAIDISSPDWEMNTFLEDHSESKPCELYYRLGNGTTFSQDEVLNHRIGNQSVLSRGSVMEGVLLARSFAPIPERYLQLRRMPITVSVWDQFGDVVETTVELYVDYAARLVVKNSGRKSNLFEREKEATEVSGTTPRLAGTSGPLAPGGNL